MRTNTHGTVIISEEPLRYVVLQDRITMCRNNEYVKKIKISEIHKIYVYYSSLIISSTLYLSFDKNFERSESAIIPSFIREYKLENKNNSDKIFLKIIENNVHHYLDYDTNVTIDLFCYKKLKFEIRGFEDLKFTFI